MASCLGIYIDKNLIKYAKVKKSKDSYKVESFNVEVFEDLEMALEKVVTETSSQRIPISINVANELYNYFDVFSVLEKKDITKSLDIEFEMLCAEKGYDKKLLESRYILRDNYEDPDKYKAIYISANKKEVTRKITALDGYRLMAMAPISTSITNLIEADEEENIAIINIENETKITTVVNGQINRVDVLNSGLEDIVETINKQEMSWKKAYNVFKNITIYNQEAKSLDKDDNEYLYLVMPKLNKMAQEIKKVLNHYKIKFNKVYITGMGATISNIDMYFQEEIGMTRFEVLKPYFIDPSNTKVPTKDYIEVNSAIALALDGLGCINKDLNFAPYSRFDNLDIENIKQEKENFDIKKWKEYLKEPITLQEKIVLRGIAAVTMGLVFFMGIGGHLMKRNTEERDLVVKTYQKSLASITEMDSQLSQIESYSNTYADLINSADELNETTKNMQNKRIIGKDAIPNLLNKIMFIIPQQVQIISIKNTTSNHIVIKAVSEKYEQLGYFSAAIKNENVLKNIQSTSGTKSDSLVEITIEGDLP